MAQYSDIEWTHSTWNPVTGCTKFSSGCRHCYAERMAVRLQAMGNPSYKNGFEVTLQERALGLPLSWRKPRMVFVNSMSDMFLDRVPLSYIRRVFAVMAACPQHVFQMLTKRSARMRELAPQLKWPRNLWMGVTVEEGRYYRRINDLRAVPVSVRFLSCEPLLGPLENLPLEGVDWVIVGGESGPNARPMKQEWALSLRKQCRAARVPFFFKQWGGVRKDLTGRELQGRIYDEMPPIPNLARTAQLQFDGA
jgi:protein gp37